MKRFLVFVVFLVAGIMLFSSVVRTVGWQEVWNAIQGFWGEKGILLLLLTLLMLFLGVIRWREILRYQGYQIPFFSLCKQYFGGFSLSFFVPMIFLGSELFRAYALKEFHQVPLQRGIVSVVVERFLEITTYLFVVGVGIIFLLVSKSVLMPMFFGWIISGVVILGIAILFFYLKSYRKESIIRMFFPSIKGNNEFLEMEQEVLRFFRLRNRAFWEGLFLSFAKVSFVLLRTFVLAGLLGKLIGLFAAITITGFSFLSLLIPIPGQLGVHEALQVFVFQSLGFQGHTGAAFAFLVRAAEIVVAIGGLIMFLRILSSLLNRLFLGKLERIFNSFRN